ncbi:MAG: PTS sugar transporter subunit IIA [Pyrinomonadaceae bacterium]
MGLDEVKLQADEAIDAEEITPSVKHVAGVIVTHGQLATELLAAAEMIVGTLPHITAVSIGWHDDVELAREQLERAIARVNEGCGVLLLTDMFGGTPSNIAAMFLADKSVEIVTGVNLPMVIKLASSAGDESLAEVASHVRDQGQQAIYLAGELLAPTGKR